MGVDVVQSTARAAAGVPEASASTEPASSVTRLRARPFSRERSPRPRASPLSSSPSALLRTSAADSSVAVSQVFTIGSSVTLVDLVARPELNGRTGTVQRFDASDGRYAIDVGIMGTKAMRVLAKNLRTSLFATSPDGSGQSSPGVT